jgi:enamine deaminase RidA (YjgF/YER057c/UK114 family)
VTTFIEVILNQELGEPFRRDAMKKPVVVAGIDAAKDMRHFAGGARPARTCIGVTDLVRDALIEIDCIARR